MRQSVFRGAQDRAGRAEPAFHAFAMCLHDLSALAAAEGRGGAGGRGAERLLALEQVRHHGQPSGIEEEHCDTEQCRTQPPHAMPGGTPPDVARL
ncbi:hypothetical protein [Streptomyces chilikensis]|uniref:Uncharacterized protein n=1 Tax=Streptomyces chilikensis TaxID=1194079 RepID=A0ABV3EIV3_9ACTN